MPDADHTVLEAECGKGTYVRSLARDLGRRLGCFGHVTALRRLVVGPFDDATMLPLDTLITAREEGTGASLDRYLVPIGFVLGELPEVAVQASDAAPHRPRPVGCSSAGANAPVSAAAAHATYGGRSIAVGEIGEGAFHPKRVFRG